MDARSSRLGRSSPDWDRGRAGPVEGAEDVAGRALVGRMRLVVHDARDPEDVRQQDELVRPCHLGEEVEHGSELVVLELQVAHQPMKRREDEGHRLVEAFGSHVERAPVGSLNASTCRRAEAVAAALPGAASS